MTKHIAFLRGINVGNIRIKMTDLKSAFEQMGYKEVKTWLQTGNVVFESDQSINDLKNTLEKGLSDTFHYKAYVLLYEFAVLADIIAQYPFERDENHHAYVVFIEGDAAFEELRTLSQGLGEEADRVAPGNGVLYWKVKVGETLDTAFAKTVAKTKYKRCVTVRNINTLEKMAE